MQLTVTGNSTKIDDTLFSIDYEVGVYTATAIVELDEYGNVLKIAIKLLYRKIEYTTTQLFTLPLILETPVDIDVIVADFFLTMSTSLINLILDWEANRN